MRRKKRAMLAWLMALALAAALSPAPVRASAGDIYFTAANDTAMDLDAETMPFWANGAMYVASRLFEGTDLGVNYVRNDSLGLAILYSAQTDLRFDLAGQSCYDRDGNEYDSYAVERGGVVFFPLPLVCSVFGLTWSYNETDTAPLIRVTSDSAILDDRSYIDAAASLMANLYNAYLRSLETVEEPPPEEPIQAVEGQKVYLLLACSSPEQARGLLGRLDGVQATFLLTPEQMEDGDLLRGLTALGHGVALYSAAETEDELRDQLRRAGDLLWQAACCRLELVWYEGGAPAEALLAENGCVRVTAELDRRAEGLEDPEQAGELMQEIGGYREDLAVCLGGELDGLASLLDGLEEGQYRLCAWRLNA